MSQGSEGKGIREFLDRLKSVPNLETTVDTSSRAGVSISYKRKAGGELAALSRRISYKKCPSYFCAGRKDRGKNNFGV